MFFLDKVKKIFPYKDKKGKTSLKTAIDNLDLEIKKGEIFGLLGPNGAGKTTTIKMMTMLIKPTSGMIRYGDLVVGRDNKKIKEMIGVVPQHINFDQDLTVLENMILHAKLHHMKSEESKKRIDELLKYVDLSDRVNDNTRSLSGGMKRRLLIVRALMHRPKLLFLDEPTVALDPQVRRKIWDLIRSLKKEGVTIILTTHYIEEAQALCDRVAILNKGKLIAKDTPEGLLQKVGKYVVEWTSEGERKLKFFNTLKEAKEFAFKEDDEVLTRQANLEDVFVELTERKIN